MIPKTKIVNVRATVPVRNVTPPLYGVKNGITMSLSDILKCLCRRAIVYEVLPDNSTVRLTTKNFRDDNTYLMKKNKEEKITPQTNVDEDEDDAMEPDEPDNAMEEREYIDGITRNVIVGKAPEHIDEDDSFSSVVKKDITSASIKNGKKEH